MNLIDTEIKGVLIIEPRVFEDQRGRFLETYHRGRYAEHGIALNFPQDNVSFSRRDSLRGLHYQLPCGQAKLVQVMKGEVLDVAVDIREGSPTFGRWVSSVLSEKNLRQMYIPAGFAHGFFVLSEEAVFTYKCSDFYAPDCEKGILWSDPDLGIDWPHKEPLISEKDRLLPLLKDVPPESLPQFSPE